MKDNPSRPPVKDMKEGLTSARKPDLTHVRTPLMTYTSRNCEYGSSKYQRGNYLRPVAPEGYTGKPTRADFERYRSYLRAAFSHLAQTLDALEMHLSTDPFLDDTSGMVDAAYAVDTDPDTSGKVGPSFLPHLGGTCASLNMAITQAVACGLLPADPGQPWVDAVCASPAAEKARAAWRTRDLELVKAQQALVTARVADGAYDVVERSMPVGDADREPIGGECPADKYVAATTVKPETSAPVEENQLAKLDKEIDEGFKAPRHAGVNW